MNRHYRTLFISDVHLGTKDCQATQLLEHLRDTQAERIFLLGDIIDLEALKHKSHWPDCHSQLLARLQNLIQAGVRVTYVPGNHDAALRQLAGTLPMGIEVLRETIYTTAAGKRLLLVHGDCFDAHMHQQAWRYRLGDMAYSFLLWVNRNHARWLRWRDKPYWSLAGAIKTRIGRVQQLLKTYRQLALARAEQEQLDGIVCGHIHHAALHQQGERVYANCGDWVESCTLLAERHCGSLTLIGPQSAQDNAVRPRTLPERAAQTG